ncbi:MAG TPA: DUF6049 family protein [Actinomycetes bacterium]|nr:DUF6049 family protein [Actinomycetes bacterium]
MSLRDPGDATGARRPGRRRLAPLVLVAALLLGLSVPAAVTPAGAVQAEEGPVGLTVESLTPGVATAGTELQVTGQVENSAREDLRDVEVRLRLSDTRLNSRTELASVVAGVTTSRDGSVVVSADLPDLAAGESAEFSLSRSVAELTSLTEFGVYVVGIEVLATRSSGFGRVAIERTLLPWVPPQQTMRPTGYSWLWPLVANPVRLADDTFADDTLAEEMAVGGRLDRLVEAGARLGEGAALTWAIEPALLSAAADMADEDGYVVRERDGTEIPGTGGLLAARWLEKVRAATLATPVVALPFGDVDLTAVHRAGLDGDLRASLELGRDVVDELLPGASDVSDTVWPVDGFVNAATLAVLRRAGVRTVVLDGRAVPPEIDLSYTPSGRARVSSRAGALTGILGEPGLADLLGGRGSDSLLSSQRFLAETAMITSELPSTGTERTIVVMPPRRWDPDLAYLNRLVDVASRAPWMAPVSLPALAGQEPPEVDRRPLRYPKQQRDRELPDTYLNALSNMHTSINVFASILTDRDALVPQLERSVILLESSWWRGRSQDRANRLVRERSYLADLRDAVRIQPGNFTFSSRSGTIPLTVANELTQEVVVDIRLEPQTPRLRVEDIAPLTIGPQTKLQIEVPAEAVAGGPVVVDVGLRTPSGTPYGQPEQLRITITQYGTVALWITIAAAAVLFLAAGVRVLRRVLGRARRGHRDAPGLAEESTGDTDDTDDTGDPDAGETPVGNRPAAQTPERAP